MTARISPIPPTVQTELARAIAILQAAGIENPRFEAELMMSHALGVERVAIIAHPERELSRSEHLRFRRMLARRARRYPLAYLLKKQDFWGMEFEVNPAVLIPRPVTETLVEAVLEFLRGHTQPVIADVGTGSGAIAVALAREMPEARIVAIDISPAALRVARRNAKRLVPDHRRVRFLLGDLLGPIVEHGLAGKLDAICSNPPYVARTERSKLQPEVGVYEPLAATDGGDDGLDLYRSLAAQSAEALRPGGCLFVEVGAGQAARVQGIFTNMGLAAVSIRRDLQRIERVVITERRT